MIIDTDVLIWYLRGNQKARDIVENNIPFSISVVTHMELIHLQFPPMPSSRIDLP